MKLNFRTLLMITALCVVVAGCQQPATSSASTESGNTSTTGENTPATEPSADASKPENAGDPKKEEPAADGTKPATTPETAASKTETKTDKTQKETPPNMAAITDEDPDKAAAEKAAAEGKDPKKVENQEVKKPEKTPPPSPVAKKTPAEKLKAISNLNASARSFEGSWTLKEDPIRVANEKKLIERMAKMGKKWSGLSSNLQIKPDGTFTMTEIFADQNRTITGTYKLNQGLLELTFKTVNGAAPTKNADKNILLLGVSKDGKTVTRGDTLTYVKK